jgi:predicted NBD/HSP70 family sugar kinase
MAMAGVSTTYQPGATRVKVTFLKSQSKVPNYTAIFHAIGTDHPGIIRTMPKIRLPHAHAAQILRLIFEHSQISRADLAAETGFSAFLVSKLCELLIDAGYISESGSGESSGGRRPALLSISPGLGRVIGIHIGTVNVRIALTDMAGTSIEYVRGASRANEGPEVAIPHLIGLVEQVIRQAGLKKTDIQGIGTGISGVLDRHTGTTLFWPKIPQWVNVPVRKLLEDHFEVPVEVEDTPRTMAMAERRIGAAQRVREFVYVMIGAGTGSALYLNGQLYTGSAGFAGEFGHITVDEDGPLCSCGNRGCIETLVSAGALIRRAQQGLTMGMSTQLWQLSGGDSARISVETVAQAARKQDRFSLGLFREVGSHLGTGLVALINLLNPELVVIGGGMMSAAADLLMPQIETAVRERALVRTTNDVRIQASTLQDPEWARGAALLSAEKVLEPMFLEFMASTSKKQARPAERLDVQ